MQVTKSKNVLSGLTYSVGRSIRLLGEVLLFTARTLGGMSIIVAAVSGVIALGSLGGIILFVLYTGTTCVLCVLVAIIGSILCRIGKKLSTNGAERLLLLDPRKPVLYLRSFVDDQVASSAVAGGQQVEVLHRSMAQAFRGDTEEEILASEFNRIGPCIAVGKPAERLPPIGAARMYFEDSEWEEGVRTLMMRSELVVMRAGTTRGFLLELEMAVKSLNPKQLIILLPFETEKGPLSEVGRAGYIEFREAAHRILQKELPLFYGSKVSGSSLSGLIHFHSDWTPQLLRLSDVGDTIKESLESISKRYSIHGVI